MATTTAPMRASGVTVRAIGGKGSRVDGVCRCDGGEVDATMGR